MKKIIIFLIVSVFFIISLYAQSISNYTFTTFAPVTLEDMSTGTTQLIGGSTNGVASGITDIGFTYYFMSVQYSQFSVNSNGQLKFGTSIIPNSGITNAMLNTPLLIPMSGDNKLLSTGKVHYKLKGSSPNRILVVEWKDLVIPYPINDNNPPVVDYTPSQIQVYIYESTGLIEFKYGTVGNNSLPTITRSTFISSSNSTNTVKYIAPDMVSAINSSTVETYFLNTNNIDLLLDRRYSFTPPVAPVAPTWKTEPITSITGNSLTLNWNDLSVNETGFHIYCSIDGGVNFSYITTSGANTTSYIVTGSLANINNWWKIAAVNEGAISQFTIAIKPDIVANKILTITSVMLEGLYNGNGLMRQARDANGPHLPANVADHITLELHDATIYATVVYTVQNVPLSTVGEVIVSIPPQYNASYYITIKHRNSLQTTTSSAVSFAGSTVNKSFGTPANVYNGNLGLSADNHYLIYAGDVNQDGIVDTGDMNEVDNGSTSILIGYNASDVNGDGIVDTSDMNFIDTNSMFIVRTKVP